MEGEMILPNFKRKETWRRIWRAVGAAVIIALTPTGVSAAAAPSQKSFNSAEEAVKALAAAAKDNNEKELLAIFGPSGKALIDSGDKVADKDRRERFVKAYDEKNSLVQKGDELIVVIGKDDWPFPIPLAKKGTGWVFDTEKGRQEVLNRRIGENELFTIQTLLAVVDAQREYAMKDRDKNGLLEYAQKFVSDAGKKNGLYWDTKAGDPQSPLGPIMAQAKSQGYQGKPASSTAVPYHGYYYRILTAQGRDASGGAYSYLVNGKMIGGFAVVAYPAEYDNSGVMTFIVNYEGKVFQKNLGKNTASIAKAMKEYNPDSTWSEVKQ